jgi:hypothetical protein
MCSISNASSLNIHPEGHPIWSSWLSFIASKSVDGEPVAGHPDTQTLLFDCLASQLDILGTFKKNQDCEKS